MSSPIRILHVISGLDPRHGGPTTALAAMMRGQRDAGLHVELVSTYCDWDNLDFVEQLRKENFNVHLIGPATRTLAWSRKIKPTLRELVPTFDVIHIHALWEEIQHRAARVAKQFRKPYLITPHGMLDPWSLGQGGFKKKLYFMLRLRRDLNQAAAIHFTDDLERDLIAPLAVTAPSLVQRLNIDLDDFVPAPAAGWLRETYSQIGERKIVLFMSRIHPKKGLDLLIPAFAQCEGKQGDDKHAVLVIAGPDRDDYRKVLDPMIAQHRITDRVIYTGMLVGKQRAAALADATLFALPSYQENFGVVVIEALSVGVPVILSDKVNIHRQISDNHLGAVVPTEIDALSRALSQWLGDDTLRQSTSLRAKEFVAQHYDRMTIVKRWCELYRTLIGR